MGLGPTEDQRLGLGPRGDLTMGLRPTEDQRLGLGPVGDLTIGLGPTEDQRLRLGPMGDLTVGLGPMEDQRLGLGLVGDLTMGLGPTEDHRLGHCSICQDASVACDRLYRAVVDPVLGGLDARPSEVPASHVWAYRDVPDDALAVLLFVRHARQLWTLLNKLGFVLCPLDLLETPRLWIVEATLGISGVGCLGACCGGGLVLTQMTRSVPTSFDGVTHYGDLGMNFNQGGPSCELQPRMPQCTSLENAYRGWMMSEVVLVQALNANAPVVIVDVTRGWRPMLGRNPNAVNAGLELDAVNAGLESDAGPKLNVVNAGPKPDAEPKPKNKAEAQCGAEARYNAWGHGKRRASNHTVTLSVSKKLVSVSLAWEGGSILGPQLALPWRKGEGRRWPAREGWQVMWGGWPGWTASGHSTSRHGEVKTVGGLPAKVGTTRLSCEVGGRDGRPLVIARLAIESVLLGKPLTGDGGPRFKGVNSLKSSEDLWGPVRWQSSVPLLGTSD
ncbi:hypothetical protein CRG98_030642 [Punica granatum]|uniref:Uncharacterized protein n=1 Tax=Punica granatum TaxID=22663 RepID=A0A2I0IYE6_PUNGR|nr:hypothetical protein CRG98_030642 [Punica granatum]